MQKGKEKKNWKSNTAKKDMIGIFSKRKEMKLADSFRFFIEIGKQSRKRRRRREGKKRNEH